jgi:hypothetical protein
MYHYTLLVVPAVITTLLFLSAHYKPENVIFILMLIGLLLSIWFVSCSVFNGIHQHLWDETEKDKIVVQETYHLNQEPSVLYLDHGDAPYYVEAPSACRYVAPLIIQRNWGDRDLTGLPAYTETMNCIMSYKGKYIILGTDWFGKHESVNQKIADEYQQVYHGYFWDVHQRIGDEHAILS